MAGTTTWFQKTKKKLTLSVDSGVIESIKSTDINLSDFVENMFIEELKKRDIPIRCPHCNQVMK